MGFITYVVVAILMICCIIQLLGKLKRLIFGKPTSKQIPSPWAYPVFRHLPFIWNDAEVNKVFLKWANQFKDEGIFVADFLLGSKRICIFKKEFIKRVLVTNCYKYKQPDIVRGLFPSIAGGLFDANGKEHAWQRKMLNPAFSYSSVLDYISTFDKHGNNLIEVWRKEIEKSLLHVAEIDVGNDINHFSLDVIGETAFGYNFATLKSGESNVSKAVEMMIKVRGSFISRILRRVVPFYEKLPLKSNSESAKAMKIMNSVVNEVIQNRREKLRQQQNENVDIGKDLLAKMMLLQDSETKREMTDQLLQSEVHTFMIAGHETTSVALTWTFFFLATHRAVQEKARHECKDVIGDDDSHTEIGAQQLEKLVYVTAVIKESLRMVSPANVAIREAIKDDQFGDYAIHKGDCVLILVNVMHHLEENWPKHDQFIPERFLKNDESATGISNYNFLPFSMGPKNCIGQKFAMTEMQVVVAKLLYTFQFDIDPHHPRVIQSLQFTVKPKPMPRLRVSLINN